ncbi:MAG TPA: hypothetical protein VK877_00270 [Pseudolabrys sp.]|nr:hypothetical protein [Pseudolabrys sp.]
MAGDSAVRLIGALAGTAATISLATAADLPAEIAPPAPSAAALFASDWSLTFASELRYFSWKSDRGYPPSSSGDVQGRGSQLYVPFAAQLAGKLGNDLKVDILGRGGWVRARQSTSGLSGAIDTITDTVASASATYLGFTGFQPFVSVSFNFPTGESNLSPTQRNARMDPDLVDISSFGEGFNVGPTLGISVPVAANLVVTTSVGYTRRGAFLRESSLSPADPTVTTASRIDPGDVLTGTASIGYQLGQLTGRITGSVSGETDTVIDGQRLFRAGMRYLVSGAWSYAWPASWGVTTLSASASHAKKNKVLFVNAGTLAPVAYDIEPFNSNANLYRAGIEHLFPMGQLWVGPTASYLLRDRNGYDSMTLQFVPAKERFSAGLLARFAASERITFNARVEHVWTNQHDNSGDVKTSLLLVAPSGIPVTGVPAIESTGWQIAGGANVRF